MKKTPIGKLVKLRRYPVKSMAGEDLQEVYIHESGLNGDRIYAFYDPNSDRYGLPYITAREIKEMVRMYPRFIDEPDPATPYGLDYLPQIDVKVDGQTYSIDDDRLIQYLTPHLTERHHNLSVQRRKVGFQDARPVSIVSMQSIAKLSEERGSEPLDPLRFRSNFYVEWDTDEPFYEDSLLGKSLQVGSVVMHITERNTRCRMINVDPETAEKDTSVLKTVTKLHDVKFGIYGDVHSTGTVKVNDTIYLIDPST
ncbi:MAG: MOSC domain-containing protein [Candidatus Kariarchaeaceae archaeon]